MNLKSGGWPLGFFELFCISDVSLYMLNSSSTLLKRAWKWISVDWFKDREVREYPKHTSKFESQTQKIIGKLPSCLI